jgi:hypothetical protein
LFFQGGWFRKKSRKELRRHFGESRNQIFSAAYKTVAPWVFTRIMAFYESIKVEEINIFQKTKNRQSGFQKVGGKYSDTLVTPATSAIGTRHGFLRR